MICSLGGLTLNSREACAPPSVTRPITGGTIDLGRHRPNPGQDNRDKGREVRTSGQDMDGLDTKGEAHGTGRPVMTGLGPRDRDATRKDEEPDPMVASDSAESSWACLPWMPRKDTNELRKDD